MSQAQIKIRIPFANDVALGPGKADLLEAIKSTGSISAAAKSMHMSYKRAWDLVNTMNNSFKMPLVVTTTGGKHGGGAEVSELGLKVLSLYRCMEEQALRAIQTQAIELIKELNSHA